MRDDSERLHDILKAIEQILSKTDRGRAAFDSDDMLQVWVLHHVQIIGEAARSLSEAFRVRHPNPVWSKAAGMRHILVHHYFEIDAPQTAPRLRCLSRSFLGRSWGGPPGPQPAPWPARLHGPTVTPPDK